MPFIAGEDGTKLVKTPKTPAPKSGMRKGVYLAGTMAAAGGFVVGFDSGAISGIMAMDPFVRRFLDRDVAYREGLLVAMMLLTAALGGLLSGVLCDRWGRKYTILLGTWAFALGALFETIGQNFAMMIVGRLFIGFGEGFLTNAIPLYHSEIAPPDIRGRLISLYSAMCSVGTITGFFVNFGTSYWTDSDWCWRTPFLLQLGFCIMLNLAFLLPFSPRWLVDKGRSEEALVVLAKLNETTIDDPTVQAELATIQDEIDREKAFGRRTYRELFQGSNLKRTLFALFTGNGAAFTGTDAISYYSTLIFIQTGLHDTSLSLVTSGASSALALLCTLFTLATIDKIGRKLIFALGAGVMATAMYIVGALFQVYHTTADADGNIGIINTSARNTVIALIFIFQAAYAFSWGPVAYVYPAEILNQRTRAKGLALAYGLNWVVGIFMTFVMPIFMDRTIYGGYYFFGGTCTILFAGVFLLPETKGYSLEEIDRLFVRKDTDFD